MKLHELAPTEGAKKARKRVGRGNGSGHGTFSGRGSKGQKARSGGQVNPRFEGGQIPIVLRLPRKRGFNNIFKQRFHIVNLDSLDQFAAKTEVTPELLAEAGLIRDTFLPVKLLGTGELAKPMTIRVHRWSQSAQQKVEAAGGALEKVQG
ncbi:MAG TPA: 50S ribosomal protein L15 [Chloroflexota bacterium]|nr:50S ribosomal protein L15 [Chloroflexota bacterium]HEX2987669.1 50S ribosomal protein L15 [Chloroflexota bacterium]